MADRREILQNDTQTTLNGALTDVATSVVVTDGSAYPADGDYRIMVDDEIMRVTARSGNTFTVVRAQEGTTGVAHNDGSTVIYSLTEEAIEHYNRDRVPLWDVTPPLRLYDASGNPILSSGFTWVNQGGATATDRGNSVVMNVPNVSGANVRLLKLAAPSTPYHVILGFQCFGEMGTVTTFPRHGLWFRESASGKLMNIMFRWLNTAQGTPDIEVEKFNSPTSFNASATARVYYHHWPMIWFRIGDDGVDLTFDVGPNGIDWDEVFTEARGTFFTTAPDEVGFGANSAGEELWMTAHHFSFTA